MKKYRIIINSIDSVYEAVSKEQALELYAKDAGYDSYAEPKRQFPFDDVDPNNNEKVIEITKEGDDV